MDSWKSKKEELLRRLKEDERNFLKSVSASADLAGGYEDERGREAFKDVQRDAFWVYLAGMAISNIENAQAASNPAETSISAAASKGFVANRAAKSNVTGYQIRYADSKSMGNAESATVNSAKKTQKAVSGINGKTKYWIQVRTYKKTKNGTKYSDWSKKRP